MPTPLHLKAPFHADAFYHIVCKSIDGLQLFYDLYDYKVFLDRFKKFAGDFLDTWSYCLLSNHTHHVCKVKSEAAIENFIGLLAYADKTKAMQAWINDKSNPALLDSLIERQLNSFFASFANYINNKYSRKGGLFQKPFKRLWIYDDAYLHQAIVYTNANAQKHKLVSDFKQYPHSSYHDTINGDGYYVQVAEVLDFFGGVQKFIQIHETQVAYFYKNNWPSSKLE